MSVFGRRVFGGAPDTFRVVLDFEADPSDSPTGADGEASSSQNHDAAPSPQHRASLLGDAEAAWRRRTDEHHGHWASVEVRGKGETGSGEVSRQARRNRPMPQPHHHSSTLQPTSPRTTSRNVLRMRALAPTRHKRHAQPWLWRPATTTTTV